MFFLHDTKENEQDRCEWQQKIDSLLGWKYVVVMTNGLLKINGCQLRLEV